ncbi:hypothetical protein [Flavobacterium aestuarii]|uniref:hypothetical protein n=1 Tax=Flavobacterium aestuarii TaxID=3149227 RepID=UPI0032B4974D
MKKTNLILATAMFSACTLFINCRPSTKEETAAQENVQEAEEDVQEAKEELSEAKHQANAEEWQNFKDDMNAAIEQNDARIAALKQKIKNSGKAADAAYDKKIDELKEKNEQLKIKIDSYKNDADSDWQSFKREFNHDMDELGNALKDITVNNKN